MNQEGDDDNDDGGEEYDPTTKLLLEMAMTPKKRKRQQDLNMGCFHLLIHGVLRCLQELKTICERRRHHKHSYQQEEENTPLLTANDNLQETEDYLVDDNDDTSNHQVTALDQAMANFVESNDPEALLHVFDVAIKDDKQD